MVKIVRRQVRVKSEPVNTSKMLSFNLNDEEFAIDILQVKEIKAITDKLAITKILNAPAYLKGVINLEHVVVPIIDLRILYHIKPDDYEEFKVIIILNLNNKLIGIIVDDVHELIELTQDQINPTPNFLSTIDRSHISGIATINDRNIVLLDIEKLLFSNEIMIDRWITDESASTD